MDMRQLAETYEMFFTYFIPAIGRRTYWKHVVANAKTDNDITTVSNEAFVLLILENNWNRWLDIYIKNDGKIVPMKGRGKRYLDCDILPKYTRGGAMPGLHSERTGDFGKGWTNEGIERFNELFDKVKEDRINNPHFITNWLRKERERLRDQIKKATKDLDTVPQARHELFSDSDEEQHSRASKRHKTAAELEASRSLHWHNLQKPIASDEDDNAGTKN